MEATTSATMASNFSAVSWRLVLLTGLIGSAITVIIGFEFSIAIIVVGILDVFLGVPFGLIALLGSWHYRVRIRRTGTAVYGAGSRFGTIPQMASFGLYIFALVLMALLLLNTAVLRYEGFAVTLGFNAVAVAGLVLCLLTGLNLLTANIYREEQYALQHGLPARHMILAHYTLGWATWALALVFVQIIPILGV